MIYQTDKFILKADVKNGLHYVALQNKETEETLVKDFKTEKAAMKHFGKVLGWDQKKVKELKESK